MQTMTLLSLICHPNTTAWRRDTHSRVTGWLQEHNSECRTEKQLQFSALSLWGARVVHLRKTLSSQQMEGQAKMKYFPAGRARLQQSYKTRPFQQLACQIKRLAIRKSVLEQVVLKQERYFKRPEDPEILRRIHLKGTERFFSVQNKCSFLLTAEHQ